MPANHDASFVDTMPANVAVQFFDRVAKSSTAEAYRFPVGETWESVTWAEAGDRVTALAAGLLSLGIETEQRVGRRFDPRLQQIVNAALSDNSIGNALAFIDALDRELELVENADPGWANSELGAFLSQEILAAREFGIGDAGQLVRNRLQSILDDLRSKQRESSAILIETDLAEANAISADLRAELYRGAADTAGETVHSEQMFWTFEGEYWRDELGYYFYHIESACR